LILQNKSRRARGVSGTKSAKKLIRRTPLAPAAKKLVEIGKFFLLVSKLGPIFLGRKLECPLEQGVWKKIHIDSNIRGKSA
jgi:hypothetical protein